MCSERKTRLVKVYARTSFILKKAIPVSRESDPAWCCRPILFSSSWSATSWSPPYTHTHTQHSNHTSTLWFGGFQWLKYAYKWSLINVPFPCVYVIRATAPLGSCSSSSGTWRHRWPGRTGWGSGRSRVPPQGVERLSGASPGNQSRSRWKIQSQW